MHAAEREQAILKLVREQGFVAFRTLDRALQASPATLRRDLDRLESAGHIVRVRGGARDAQAGDDAPRGGPHLLGAPFNENVGRNRRAKAAIGRAAAALCGPGEAVIIDGGSTTLQMCEHLGPLNLQVLTNSLHIVSALLPQAGTRVSIPGGSVFREQNIVLSPYEGDTERRYHASKLFLGAASIRRQGLMQTDTLLVQAERRLFQQAEQVVVLVDSSKFGAPTGHVVCGLDEVDLLVTDSGASAEDLAMLEQAGVRTVVVDPD